MSPLVCALGEATVSIVGGIPRLPEPAERLELEEVSVQLGGGAAVAAITAAGLGCRSRLATKLADDFLGGFITSAIVDAGVELVGCDSPGSVLSPFQFDAVARDRKRIGFTTAGDTSAMAVSELDIDGFLDGASALMVDGSYPEAQIEAAEHARKRDIPVVFDGGRLREGLGELVALSDVLIASERLASELAPRGELQDSLLELQRLGPRAVIITLGGVGSIGLHGDQLVEQESFDVSVVDTVGAGHVYHGAFVTGLLSSLPFARCMEFASATAALSCGKLGAMGGIPSRDDVVELIRNS